MNDLSWLLYLADVVGSLKTVCILGAVACAMFWAIMLPFKYIEHDELYRPPLRLPITLAVLALAASLTPSTSTVYAIAASEMGERALNTQTGGKAVEALNAWLDRQIADDSEER